MHSEHGLQSADASRAGLWSRSMTCREVIEFLAEYLAGALPPEQHRVFTEHLDMCPDCAAYLKGYEEAIRLGKAALGEPDRSLSDDMPEELVQAILAARRRRS
jgi:predicted anti-sigma-YlaC factor YlaD